MFEQNYNFAFLDEASKREIRRATLKAIAIPGYQVPFASRELPIGRGWGTGGLQLTLSLVGKEDVLKVIDQGSDDSVNAVSIRRLVEDTTGIRTTESTEEASIIQTRHRTPDHPLRNDQIMVYQVPKPEPLRDVEPSEMATARMHGEMDYSPMWLALYENIVKYGNMARGADYPVMINKRYLMAPSPIPRWDNPKFHYAGFLSLFGAGREKKIYAIPPFTHVESLHFDDYPFEIENFDGASCIDCGSANGFLQVIPAKGGTWIHRCSDTAFCLARRNASLKNAEVQA